MGGVTHAEKMAMQLREIFQTADTSGDGTISSEEFEDMLQDREVLASFEGIGLEKIEVKALFAVFSADDGAVDYEEFLGGAIKLNNSAPKFDAVQTIHFHVKLQRVIQQIEKQL